MDGRSGTEVTISEEVAGGVRTRPSIMRSAILPMVGTLALFAFILVQGDSRRRQRAVDQAQWHMENLAQLVGEAGVLPLNLAPESAPGHPSKMFEWISRQEARRLRNSHQRVIISHTRNPERIVLGPSGRAVVFFKDGQFSAEWISLSRFEELFAAQQDHIRRLAGDAGSPPDNGT